MPCQAAASGARRGAAQGSLAVHAVVAVGTCSDGVRGWDMSLFTQLPVQSLGTQTWGPHPCHPPPGAACPQPAPHGETVVELGGVQGGAGRLGGVGEWTAGLLSLDRKSGMKAGPSGTCECGLDRRGFSGQGAVAGRVLGRVSRRVWEPGTPDVGDVVNIHTPSSIPCDPPGRPLTIPVWPVWGLLQT